MKTGRRANVQREGRERQEEEGYRRRFVGIDGLLSVVKAEVGGLVPHALVYPTTPLVALPFRERRP